MAAFAWYWGKRRPDPTRGSFQQPLVRHHLILAGLPTGTYRLISEYLGSSGMYAEYVGALDDDLVVVLKNVCEQHVHVRGQFNVRYAEFRDR